MKLADTLIFSLAVVFFIIGVYEIMTLGVGQAYWSIMLSIALFFFYIMRKRKS